MARDSTPRELGAPWPAAAAGAGGPCGEAAGPAGAGRAARLTDGRRELEAAVAAGALRPGRAGERMTDAAAGADADARGAATDGRAAGPVCAAAGALAAAGVLATWGRGGADAGVKPAGSLPAGAAGSAGVAGVRLTLGAPEEVGTKGGSGSAPGADGSAAA